jgi:hypothetical protein
MSAISQTNANKSNIAKWWTAELRDGVPIDHLFMKLDGRYNFMFTAKAKTPDALQLLRKEWLDGFCEKSVTGKQVFDALEVCRARHPKYPPNIQEFLECIDSSSDPQTAHAEAVEQMHRRETGDDVWSHPAVYWAAVKIGAFDLNNLAWEQIKNRWTHALDEMRRRENLEPVPPRLVSLPAPGRLSVPDEVAKKRMHDIMQNLTAKMSMGNGGVDMLKTD